MALDKRRVTEFDKVTLFSLSILPKDILHGADVPNPGHPVPCLVGAVEQSEDVPFLHGDLTRALLLIVIESQDKLLPSLIIHGGHLLLISQRKGKMIKCHHNISTSTQQSNFNRDIKYTLMRVLFFVFFFSFFGLCVALKLKKNIVKSQSCFITWNYIGQTGLELILEICLCPQCWD